MVGKNVYVIYNLIGTQNAIKVLYTFCTIQSPTLFNEKIKLGAYGHRYYKLMLCILLCFNLYI